MKYIHYDKYHINDKSNLDSPIDYKRNYARILINGNTIEETNNMVVMPGKSFTAQKIFGKTPPAPYPDLRDYLVTHFGVGSGGSTSTGGIHVLTGPDICDIDMLTPIAIDPGNTTFLTSPNGVANVCKPIEQDGTFEFAVDTHIDCSPNSYYTIMKCTCVITRTEPTDLNPGDTVKIDEAALYATHNENTLLFARICFAPKEIEISTEFIIEWYVIC